MRRLFIIALVMGLIGYLPGQKPPQDAFRVKYVSSENVFLDGGRARGLQVGDKLIVRNKQGMVAEIEVVYVAEHSASCKILKQQAPIEAGYVAVVFERAKREQPAPEPKPQPQPKEKPQPAPRVVQPQPPRARESRRERGTAISGSISAQLYRVNDLNPGNLDFTQPTFRLNLKLSRLFGSDYQIRIRTRSRYNQRTRSYSADIPKQEWRNRVYELSFGFENRHSRFNYKVGRIFSNEISGVGYVDGIMIRHNFSPSLGMGILAGTQPDWRNSDFQTSLRKYGFFINYQRGDYRATRFETTLAAAGEYHTTTVSRELVYIQNQLSGGNRWYIYQSAELDINRQWRRDKTGENLSLSNLFISGRYRISSAITVGLTFDNRKNYWTYEIRSVADSLFDDALRTGLRGNISLRLPSRTFVYLAGGFRKRATDAQPTYSFSGGLTKANFLLRRLSFSLNAAGFSTEFTRGFTGTARLGHNFVDGHRLEVAFGTYAYNFTSGAVSRNNQWVQANLYLSLLRHLFLSGQLEYDWGSDLKGQRILAEFGYRF